MVANNTGPNIVNEKATVRMMIYLYCHKKHHTQGEHLCEECNDLLHYAMQRLTLCRFGENKTTCERCPKHCYRKDYKEKIRQVMRFSGPRMLIYHPVKALQHLYKNLFHSKKQHINRP